MRETNGERERERERSSLPFVSTFSQEAKSSIDCPSALTNTSSLTKFCVFSIRQLTYNERRKQHEQQNLLFSRGRQESVPSIGRLFILS